MVAVDALELDDLVDILGRPISFIDAVTGTKGTWKQYSNYYDTIVTTGLWIYVGLLIPISVTE